MNKINVILLNPVRLRIVQHLALQPTMTAQELSQRISDVPRTTLYRHIRILLDAGILAVTGERKVRGSLERTLALNAGKIAENNTLENAPATALEFLMQKYAAYHAYFHGEAPDPGRDRIFLNATVLMADDAEFDRFLGELRELLLKYSALDARGRKPRDISILSAPANQA